MKRFLTFITHIFLVYSVFAQDTVSVLSLKEVISTSLENNYNIRIARNIAEIANNNVTVGNAGFLPVLGVSGSYDRSTQNTEQEFASGDTQSRTGASRKSLTGAVNMSWTLFDGTRMFATLDRLENQALLANQELKSEIDNSISQLMINFYQIAFEERRLELLQSNIEFSLERLRIVEEKYNLGKESKMAKLQAQVDYNSDQFSLLRQKELVNGIKQLLLFQMGADPTDFSVEYTFEIDSTLVLAELLLDASSQNPVLLSQMMNQKVLEKQMEEIDRSKWPELNLNLGYGYSNLKSEAGFLALNQTYDFRYGLSANFTIFDGLNQKRQYQNSKVMMESGKIQMEAAESQIETTLLSTFTSYSNNLELAKLEQLNLDVARENSEIALERFKLGSSDALELREAQINSVNAQIRYVEALFNAKVAEIQLNTLAGRLSTIY